MDSFLLSGTEARDEVRRDEEFQLERVKAHTRKGINPSLSVSNEVKADKWRRAWIEWKL